MIQITQLASSKQVSPQIALDGLVATYSGLNGAERTAQIELLRSIRQDLRGNLPHVLLDAALAKSQILMLSSVPGATDVSAWTDNLKLSSVLGFLLSATLLAIAWAINHKSGPEPGLAVELITMVAKSFLALTIALNASLALIISHRKNRDRRIRDDRRFKLQKKEKRFEKIVSSPHLKDSNKNDESEEPPLPIFDPSMRAPAPKKIKKKTTANKQSS
jgi:hypothetical protein